MPVTYLTVLLLSVAVALLGPFVARVAFALLPSGLTTPAGHLAAHQTRANARRLASVITPLTLLVAMAGTVLFTQTTLAGAADRQVRDGVVADAVLAAAPGAPGVPGPAADRLRALDGVTAVTEVVHTTVRSPGLDQYTVQGVTPEGLDATLRLGVTEGSAADLAALDEDGVAISDLVADTKGLHPGDTMALVLGDGTPVTLTVAAVYERGLGFGDLTLAHSLVAAHIDNPLADSVLVAGAGDPADVAARIGDALAADFPAVAVAPANHLADALAEQREASAEVAFVAMGLVLAFTTIAAVNTLAMSTADRAGEFGLLRLVGATRRQVLAMLRLEALAVAATALALGTAICLATLTAFSAGMAGGAGVSVDAAACAGIAGVAVALALVATAIPGRLALRAHRRPGLA
jgi:putative ABC transport system permease protein